MEIKILNKRRLRSKQLPKKKKNRRSSKLVLESIRSVKVLTLWEEVLSDRKDDIIII